MNTPRPQRGFSLIELAVVLVIVGLLVGGGIAALNSATQQTRRIEAERQLVHVRDALYGYAMAEGRLPCPDTDYPPDGWENWPDDRETNTAGTDCDAAGGALPWVQIGLGRRDPWGNPLHYRVDVNSPNFADPDSDIDDPAFDLSDSANLEVEDGDGGTIVDSAPAVIVSFGPQGSQVWTDGSYVCPATGFSNDENENCDNTNNTFIATEYRPPDSPNGRFDDVLIWIPLPVVKSRMVDAGLLP